MTFRLKLRGMGEPARNAVPFNHDDPLQALRAAIAKTDHPAANVVIEWAKADLPRLAALDLDWHDPERRLDPYRLSALTYGLKPAPAMSWVTHGLGLRLMYTAVDDMAADELATVAGAMFARKGRVNGMTGWEVKPQTRHPGYKRSTDNTEAVSVTEGCPGVVSLAEVRAGLFAEYRDVPEDEWQEYLEEQGLQLGRSYDHERCPIETGTPSHGAPVFVGDAGIFCHSCAAKGLGPRGTGFMHAATLIDGFGEEREPSPLVAAAFWRCHWSQARHVVREHVGLQGEPAKRFYQALMKMARPPERVPPEPTDIPEPASDNPAAVAAWAASAKAAHANHAAAKARREAAESLRDAVFSDTFAPVRVDSGWWRGDLAGPLIGEGAATLIRNLPACMDIDPKGKVRQTNRSALFTTNEPLVRYGYVPLQPLIGVDLAAGVRDHDSSRIFVVKPAAKSPFPGFQGGTPEEREARFKRATRELISFYPGADITLLRLLLVAKAYAQTEPQQPPIIYIVGRSAAGKTVHASLAAALGFDAVQRADKDLTPNRFMDVIAKAAGRASWVLIDEATKDLENKRSEPTALCNRLLELQRGVTCWELYRGSRSVTSLPAFVLCDTTLRKPFLETQVARRVRYYDLKGGLGDAEINWHHTVGGDVDTWRERYVDLAVPIAAAFVEDAKDLLLKCHTFDAAADALGVPCIRDAELTKGVDKWWGHKALFVAACNMPPTDSTSHPPERGWKCFTVGDQTPASVALEEIIGDELGRCDPSERQEITGLQWKAILGIPGVELDLHKHRRKVYFRFRCGDKVNDKILPLVQAAGVKLPELETITGAAA